MKNMKKTIGILLAFAMVLTCFCCPGFASSATALTEDSDRVLVSGEYVVDGSVTFIGNSELSSGLMIAEGAEVVIRINKGALLAAVGADAQGTKGAGAGIYVPQSSVLTIVGPGLLYAIGGNAANGEDGGKPGDGQSRVDGEDMAVGGAGGNGGSGGGGAGAGIGGIGGNGGAGGKGGAQVSVNDDSTTFTFGNDGMNGGDGHNGVSMGQVTLCDLPDRTVKGGAAGEDGKNIYNTGKVSYYQSGTFTDGSYGGGGGVGEPGFGGCAANDYGGGGAGGPGGGGGGSGTAVCDEWNDFVIEANAGCGDGYPVGAGHSIVYAPSLYYESGSSQIFDGMGGSAGFHGSAGRKGTVGTLLYHTHTFAGRFSYDDNGHWRRCTGSNCWIKDYASCGVDGAEYGEHIDKDGDFICDICGYMDVEAMDLAQAKNAAINTVYAVIGDAEPSETLADILAGAEAAINAAASYDEVDQLKEQAIAQVRAQFAVDSAAASAEALGRIEAELEKINQSLSALAEKLDELTALLIAKQTELNEKDSEIATLQNEVTAMRNELDEKNEELAAKEAEHAKAVAACRESAYGEITAAVGGDTSAKIKAAAYDAKTAIEAAETVEDITAAKAAGLEQIARIKAEEASEETDTPSSGTVCEKCGKSHADNFFGRIRCWFIRLFNLFKF